MGEISIFGSLSWCQYCYQYTVTCSEYFKSCAKKSRDTINPWSFHSFCCFCLYNHALQTLRLIVRSWLDVPTFATRRLHACHHARAPSGGRWNCGWEMFCKFCLNADLHFTFRDLLHAKATTWDRRLYFPSDGRRAEDFFALKIRRLRQGANPRTWVPKASTLPLDHLNRSITVSIVRYLHLPLRLHTTIDEDGAN